MTDVLERYMNLCVCSEIWEMDGILTKRNNTTLISFNVDIRNILKIHKSALHL